MDSFSNAVIKVLLVDDHAVVRQGTREMLNTHPQIQIVGENAGNDELLGLIRLKTPDIVLLDINLPEKNGFKILEELNASFPNLKVVLFSAHIDLQYIRKAGHLKANGFLSKTVSQAALQTALLNVMLSPEKPVYSPDIQEKLKSSEANFQTAQLTAREEEILLCVAQGWTNQVIAKHLSLSVKTVDTHIANLMKKTGLNKRTQLLAYAYEQGLV